MSIYNHPLYPSLRKFFDEPDFYDGCAFGLPLHMRRNPAKAWCGYVGVPNSHPFSGKNSSDRVACDRSNILIKDQSPIALFCEAFKEDDGCTALDILLDCPGGVTWANSQVPWGGLKGYWYFGFDCSHYNDLSPKDIIQEMAEGTSWREGTYRDFDFVLRACRKLAEQLMELS